MGKAFAVGTSTDELVETYYSDEERTILLRYLRLSTGEEFQIAAIEAPTPVVRRALLAWIRRRFPDRPLVEVSLKQLPGLLIAQELQERIESTRKQNPRTIAVLTELEEVAGASEPHPSLFMRLNLERDLIVRTLPMTCLLVAHPAALLKLRTIAPDFSHFFSALVRQKEPAKEHTALVLPSPLDWSPSTGLELADSDWPALLRAADLSIAQSQWTRARDELAEFSATPDADEWTTEHSLLHARVLARENARAGLAALEQIDLRSCTRESTVVRVLLERSSLEFFTGNASNAESLLAEAERRAEESKQSEVLAAVTIERASLEMDRGNYDEALRNFQSAAEAYRRLQRSRLEWNAKYKLAALRLVLGDWDEVIRLGMKELLPIGAEQLRDERLASRVWGLIARARANKGELDDALRILRVEVLPVYDRLGDIRSYTVTLSQIADILQRRGELDEALRILRVEVLPVYDRSGDVRNRAIALGRVANILQRRGELDEALRILRVEVLPVYDRSGDVRNRAIALGRVANILQRRGELDEALRILGVEVLPVFEELGLKAEIALTEARVGQLLIQHGNKKDGLATLERARNALDSLGRLHDQVQIRASIARFLFKEGDYKGALRELQMALQRAEAQRVPHLLVNATGEIVDCLVAQGRQQDASRVIERTSAILAEDGRWDALDRIEEIKSNLSKSPRHAKRKHKRR